MAGLSAAGPGRGVIKGAARLPRPPQRRPCQGAPGGPLGAGKGARQLICLPFYCWNIRDAQPERRRPLAGQSSLHLGCLFSDQVTEMPPRLAGRLGVRLDPRSWADKGSSPATCCFWVSFTTVCPPSLGVDEAALKVI